MSLVNRQQFDELVANLEMYLTDCRERITKLEERVEELEKKPARGRKNASDS
jgi:BMFP domain-containing protein YqiC